jgi:hypothetical protein
MSRPRSIPVWAKAACLALLVVTGLPACEEGGERLPTRCSDTNGDGMVDPLPLDDLGKAGAPDVTNPCLTATGDAVSFIDDGSGAPTTTAGTTSGGSNNGGTQNGQGGADAGAGGS